MKEILEKQGPELAKNQLVFPSEEFTEELLDPACPRSDEDEQEIEQAFEDVITG